MTQLKCAAAMVLALCAAFTAPARAQDSGRWLRAESANFIVYSDRSENQLRGAVQALEDLDATLRVLTNVGDTPSAHKLEIYLLRNASALREVWPGVRAEVRGFYDSSMESVAAFAVYRDVGEGTFGVRREQILAHEYAHHFMLHHSPNAYPRWYVEGWAEFVSTIEVVDRRAIVGTPSDSRGLSVVLEGLLPIEQILAPERVTRRSARFEEAFYATAWVAASLIANRPERQQGLNRYVAALGEGADPITGFEPAFGITPAAFHEEMREYLDGDTGRVGVRLPAEPAPMTVTRMPAAADDLLLLVARMKLYRPGDPEPAMIAQVRRTATAFPEDAFAQRAGARAALLANDAASARAALDRLLAANVSDIEARYLMGMSYWVDAATAPEGSEPADAALLQARRQFVQAFQLEDDHFPTLFAYAYSFSGSTLTEAQLNVMTRALEIAPQVNEIRIILAQELIEAARFDDAIVTLRPLVYAPHSERISTRARVLADAARRREQPPAWEEPESAAKAEE